MLDNILYSLKESEETLNKFINKHENIEAISKAAQCLIDSFKNNGSVYSCGNGGSSCDANHFAEELTGRYRKDRKALPAIAITDAGHITCVGNDYGYDFIFSRFIEGWAKPNDTLLAISTSGNSQNIIEAVKAAKSLGAKTIGLLGKTGGQLKDLVDYPIIVESSVTDRIQEVHIKIIHIMIEMIERDLFPENYT